MSARIVLIHATPLAIAPIADAFSQLWPEAIISNLLDDALATDRRLVTTLTPALYQRIESLTEYACGLDARAVLFTCSAFGAAINASAAQHNRPVLRPNEAMFNDALRAGHDIVMLATFAPAIAGMEAEFNQQAKSQGSRARLRSYVVPEAREALECGNINRHNELLAQAASTIGSADALLLAHFSMAIALEKVAAAVPFPVISPPHAAVRQLKSQLT